MEPTLAKRRDTFWSAPRKTALRYWLFQIHFYVGLIVGLVWTVISLTGSLLVFVPELRRLEAPGMTRVVPQTGKLPLEKLHESFKRERPTDKIFGIYFDFKPGWAVDFRSRAKNNDQWHTFINPYTGKVVSSLNYNHRLLQWIYELHGDLLNGREGRTVNGWFAGSLAFISTTGILLWWRGRRYWKLGFEYRVQASWKRQTWDLHNLAGFAFYLPLMIICFTGVYYGYPELTKSLFAFVTRGPSEIAPPQVAMAPPARPPLDSMLVEAQRSLPDSSLSIILFPQKRGDPFIYRMLRDSDLHRLGLNWIYLDGSNAQVLRVDQLDQQPTGVWLWRIMAPFHYGHFAGWGTRVIWTLAGTVPGILFVTSLLMWWNRSLSKKWSKRQLR